ncbi:ABC transporter permease [Planctomycetota bacterium]
MPMSSSQRYPVWLYTLAVVAWLLVSVLPLGIMLIRFGVRVVEDPSVLTKVFLDTRQWVLMGRSLGIAALATGFALLLGLPMARMLAAHDLPGRRGLCTLVLMPLLIPAHVMAVAWIHLLSPTGWVNQLWTGLLGLSTRLSMHSSLGCAWTLASTYFPVIAFLVATGLVKMDTCQHEAMRLSTGRWGVFRHATLPQIFPYVLASSCLVMIFILAQYGVPSLLGINTYPVEIFAEFSAFYDEAAATAKAIPLTVIVVVLIVFQRALMRHSDYVSFLPSSEISKPVGLDRFRYGAAGMLIFVFVFLLVIPFASVLTHTQSISAVIEALRSSRGCITSTGVLAFWAAIFSTALAFPIGHLLACKRDGWIRWLDVLCWLPIAIPGTIAGLGYVQLSNRLPALQRADSFGLFLLCAYVGMFSAFSIRIFEATFRRMDINMAEAAAVFGCPWWRRLCTIDIPVQVGAIATSMIVVFALALGELNATVLLIPPGKETLAVTIDNLLHYGANVRGSVLCLTTALVVVGMIGGGGLVGSLIRRQTK